MSKKVSIPITLQTDIRRTQIASVRLQIVPVPPRGEVEQVVSAVCAVHDWHTVQSGKVIVGDRRYSFSVVCDERWEEVADITCSEWEEVLV